MKTKLFIICSVLLSLFSCSEEGPFTMGKLEYKIEVSNVTSTTALVSVDIPHNPDNLFDMSSNCAMFLVKPNTYEKQDFNPYYDGECEYGKYMADESTSNHRVFFFDDLAPNTTYYILIEGTIGFNDNDQIYDIFEKFIKTGKTIVTAPQ